MTQFTYELAPRTAPALGLIALQSDERIEQDFRRLLSGSADLFVTRVPSGLDVTPETLAEMEGHLRPAAALLPRSVPFDVIGYGCTSGTAQIGQTGVAARLRQGARTKQVTDPVSALVAACAALGLTRLAFLSPYVESVSDRLRQVLRDQGIDTPVFGTFAEAEEAKVARIAPQSLVQAAQALAGTGGVDGIFLSCTNLNSLPVIGQLEAETGQPVLSSNLVLAWHMARLAGPDLPLRFDCRLTRADRA